MENRVAIFVLIDGLGYEYLQDDGFLQPVLGKPCRCRTILGYSSAAIPSILSGKTPAETGHWNLFYYDPSQSIFRWTKWFRKFPVERVPKLRSLFYNFLVQETKKRCGYTGYFNIYSVPLKYRYLFAYNERKDPFRESLNNGITLFDSLRAEGIEYFLSTYPSSDEASLSAAFENIEYSDTSFYFLYLTEMDGFLHQHCNDRLAIEQKLRWYEEKIILLHQAAAERFDNVTLAVFSDHGMTPVTGTFDLMSEIEKLRLRIPADYVPFYDSTMARFWFFREEARQKVSDTLMKLEVGHFVSKEELIRFGVFFPDGKFGEMVFLMNPGYVIVPSYISHSVPNGMHGFSHDDRWSDAMFMSNIRLENEPRSIIDFYSIMLQEAHYIRS
jgi:hypothetical protein